MKIEKGDPKFGRELKKSLFNADDLGRYESMVPKNGEQSCWEWAGGINRRTRRGIFYKNKRALYAHRVSHAIYVGDVPEGIDVLHSCDNSLCVNPRHLFLGTQVENMNDMREKNRQAKGVKNGSAKLSEDDVREIRKRYTRHHYGKSNARELSREYGINKNSITRIVRRELWGHVS